jgi:hypothetical protein
VRIGHSSVDHSSVDHSSVGHSSVDHSSDHSSVPVRRHRKRLVVSFSHFIPRPELYKGYRQLGSGTCSCTHPSTQYSFQHTHAIYPHTYSFTYAFHSYGLHPTRRAVAQLW